MRLSELGAHEEGVVRDLRATGTVRQRLMDMGFMPDTEVVVERVAPTGAPVWIRVCGSQVALRNGEADAIEVERTDASTGEGSR